LRQACLLFSISTSVYYYKPKLSKQNQFIADQLIELANLNKRWGFWMMHNYLRGLGYVWNHKRVYRIYTDLQLNLRRKYKQRQPARIKEPLLQPLYPNLTWSMDFMEDRLHHGVKFRSFNIIDDFNRECLNITLDTSINSKRVIRQLKELIDWRGKPLFLRVDNGPEFIASALKNWCDDNDIDLKFIQKGKPSQNGFIERFNRTYREEVLDSFSFESLNQARLFTQAWIWMYNNERPHKSLQYKTPTKFLLKYGKLHHHHSQQTEFPTFQQDININWKFLNLNVAN